MVLVAISDLFFGSKVGPGATRAKRGEELVGQVRATALARAVKALPSAWPEQAQCPDLIDFCPLSGRHLPGQPA